jgi:hypothetical protein
MNSCYESGVFVRGEYTDLDYCCCCYFCCCYTIVRLHQYVKTGLKGYIGIKEFMIRDKIPAESYFLFFILFLSVNEKHCFRAWNSKMELNGELWHTKTVGNVLWRILFIKTWKLYVYIVFVLIYSVHFIDDNNMHRPVK